MDEECKNVLQEDDQRLIHTLSAAPVVKAEEFKDVSEATHTIVRSPEVAQIFKIEDVGVAKQSAVSTLPEGTSGIPGAASFEDHLQRIPSTEGPKDESPDGATSKPHPVDLLHHLLNVKRSDVKYLEELADRIKELFQRWCQSVEANSIAGVTELTVMLCLLLKMGPDTGNNVLSSLGSQTWGLTEMVRCAEKFEEKSAFDSLRREVQKQTELLEGIFDRINEIEKVTAVLKPCRADIKEGKSVIEKGNAEIAKAADKVLKEVDVIGRKINEEAIYCSSSKVESDELSYIPDIASDKPPRQGQKFGELPRDNFFGPSCSGGDNNSSATSLPFSVYYQTSCSLRAKKRAVRRIAK